LKYTVFVKFNSSPGKIQIQENEITITSLQNKASKISSSFNAIEVKKYYAWWFWLLILMNK